MRTTLSLSEQTRLVDKVLTEAFYFEKTKATSPVKGISKIQLAKLMHVTPTAVDNWLKGRNGLTKKNLDFLRKLETIVDTYQKGNTLKHTVFSKAVNRLITVHGISKYNDCAYKFKSPRQRHWADAHNVLLK